MEVRHGLVEGVDQSKRLPRVFLEMHRRFRIERLVVRKDHEGILIAEEEVGLARLHENAQVNQDGVRRDVRDGVADFLGEKALAVVLAIDEHRFRVFDEVTSLKRRRRKSPLVALQVDEELVAMKVVVDSHHLADEDSRKTLLPFDRSRAVAIEGFVAVVGKLDRIPASDFEDVPVEAGISKISVFDLAVDVPRPVGNESAEDIVVIGRVVGVEVIAHRLLDPLLVVDIEAEQDGEHEDDAADADAKGNLGREANGVSFLVDTGPNEARDDPGHRHDDDHENRDDPFDSAGFLVEGIENLAGCLDGLKVFLGFEESAFFFELLLGRDRVFFLGLFFFVEVDRRFGRLGFLDLLFVLGRDLLAKVYFVGKAVVIVRGRLSFGRSYGRAFFVSDRFRGFLDRGSGSALGRRYVGIDDAFLGIEDLFLDGFLVIVHKLPRSGIYHFY